MTQRIIDSGELFTEWASEHPHQFTDSEWGRMVTVFSLAAVKETVAEEEVVLHNVANQPDSRDPEIVREGAAKLLELVTREDSHE
jgi:hypothetical protein